MAKTRREGFDRGEEPKDDGHASVARKVAKSKDKQSEFANSSIGIGRGITNEFGDSQDTDTTSASTKSVMKQADNTSEGTSNPQRYKTPEPVVVRLDGSPPRGNKRSAGPSNSLPQKIIKNEPTDTGPAVAHPLMPQEESRSGKRIKLEHPVPQVDFAEDAELIKLKQKEEQLERELWVAELQRQKGETRLRIAELEARRSSTISGGSLHRP